MITTSMPYNLMSALMWVNTWNIKICTLYTLCKKYCTRIRHRVGASTHWNWAWITLWHIVIFLLRLKLWEVSWIQINNSCRWGWTLSFYCWMTRLTTRNIRVISYWFFFFLSLYQISNSMNQCFLEVLNINSRLWYLNIIQNGVFKF